MGFNPAHVRRIEFPHLQNTQHGVPPTAGRVPNHRVVQLQVHTRLGLNFKNSSRFFSIQSYSRPRPSGQLTLGLQPSSARARRMSLMNTFWSPGRQSALPACILLPLRFSINASSSSSETTFATPPPILKARPA